MVLEIKEQSNEYLVIGQLTRFTSKQFKESFLKVFESTDKLIINIQGLTEIDREGVNAIARLHNISLSRGKKLCIIGLGCKDLYQHINTNDAA